MIQSFGFSRNKYDILAREDILDKKNTDDSIVHEHRIFIRTGALGALTFLPTVPGGRKCGRRQRLESDGIAGGASVRK